MELLKGVHVIETYATTTLLVDDRHPGQPA